MNEHREIRERRIEQFASYLRLMRRRQQGITSGHSYIIFSESGTYRNADTPALDRSRAAALPIAVSLRGGLDHGDPFGVSVGDFCDDPPDDGSSPKDALEFTVHRAFFFDRLGLGQRSRRTCISICSIIPGEPLQTIAGQSGHEAAGDGQLRAIRRPAWCFTVTVLRPWLPLPDHPVHTPKYCGEGARVARLLVYCLF